MSSIGLSNLLEHHVEKGSQSKSEFSLMNDASLDFVHKLFCISRISIGNIRFIQRKINENLVANSKTRQ